MKLSEMWAKTNPFQSVITHGKASGICAQILFSSYLSDSTRKLLCDSLMLSETEMIQFLGYFVSLHDIGKISPEFQNHNSIFEQKIRHERTTQNILAKKWKAYCRENNIKNKNIAGYLAAILGAHHQGKSGEADIILSGSEWELLHTEYEELMKLYFYGDGFVFPRDIQNPQGVFESILLGLTVLSDWIVSGELFSEAEQWNKDGVLKDKVEMIVSDLLENSGMKFTGSAEFGESFRDCWPNIEKPRGLQKQVEDLFSENEVKPILLMIEAPMGEGKTEAAIFAAEKMAKIWGKTGFYIGLPTAATANQMDDRVQKFFDMHGIDENVKLLHSMAWLFDNQQKSYETEEEQYISEWLNSSKRGLLSTNAVGTVDQAMLAAKDVRYGVLRLLGLMGKVLIIDEIHAYDLFMSNILHRLFLWCKALRIPVVLLSATLPWKKKKSLVEIFYDKEFENVYPSITCVDDTGDIIVKEITEVSMRQAYEIRMHKILGMSDEIAQLALDRVGSGGYLCVLANTVKQAQDIYNAIIRKKNDEEVMLFHARFKTKDRAKIEKLCVQKFRKENEDRTGKVILVATQVVEQSLDVDFDMMITAIAPMDLLMQRIGRVFRHKETRRPESVKGPVIDVLIPQNEDYGVDGRVYAPVVLKQTLHLLEYKSNLYIPNNLQKLVDDAYNEDAVPKTEREEWEKYEIREQLEGAKANSDLLSEPEKKFSPICGKANFRDEGNRYLRSKTRNGEESVRLVLVSEEEFDLLKSHAKNGTVRIVDAQKASSLMENCVNVPFGRLISMLPESDTTLFLNGSGKLSGSIIMSETNSIVSYSNVVGLTWNGGDKNEPNL